MIGVEIELGGHKGMTELEIKIIEKLLTDPAAMERAVDFLRRSDVGESAESILTSYGINLKEIRV